MACRGQGGIAAVRDRHRGSGRPLSPAARPSTEVGVGAISPDCRARPVFRIVRSSRSIRGDTPQSLGPLGPGLSPSAACAFPNWLLEPYHGFRRQAPLQCLVIRDAESKWQRKPSYLALARSRRGAANLAPPINCSQPRSKKRKGQLGAEPPLFPSTAGRWLSLPVYGK
jgi:hypothetical protein